MCFIGRTEHMHIRLLRRNVLFVVYSNCPGQQYPQISRQLSMYGTWCSGNLLFLQSLPQPLPNYDKWCKMLETIYRRMAFGTFMTFTCKNTRLCCRHWGCTVCWCDCLGTPYRHTCFIWSEFIIYSYNDILPVTSIFNIMNLFLKVLHFSGSVFTDGHVLNLRSVTIADSIRMNMLLMINDH